MSDGFVWYIFIAIVVGIASAIAAEKMPTQDFVLAAIGGSIFWPIALGIMLGMFVKKYLVAKGD